MHTTRVPRPSGPGAARSRRRLRSRVLAALTALTLSASLAACSDDASSSSDEPDGPAPSETADEVTTTESTGKAPNYDLSNAVPFEGQIFKAVTSKDAVISVDTDGVTTRSLPGAEVAWQLKPAEGFWTDIQVEENGDNGYLLSLVSDETESNEVGRNALMVQQIDMPSGDVLSEAGSTLPTDPTHAGQTPTTRILGVIGALVIVDVAFTEDFNYVHQVLAYDLTTGEQAWSAAGTEIISVAPGQLLGRVGASDKPGSLVALNPRTGKQKWTGLKGTTSVRLVGRAGATATVLRTAAFGTKEVVRVNLLNGKQKGKPVKVDSTEWTCHKAEYWRALCVLPGGKLVGWHLGENNQEWALPTKKKYAPAITYVADGKAWGNAKGNTWVLMDAATGEIIGGGNGPAPIAVNDYGALMNDNGALEWTPVAEKSGKRSEK